ncbi:hypothetical protein NC651_026201 [Populus alba x Populus x berolinensis]|nr:hypothetical protein NC651_026201 [Populus alba x Populus x berolinensis]
MILRQSLLVQSSLFPFRVFPHIITVQEKMNNYFDRCLSDSCGEETPECRLCSEATSK